MRFLHSDADSQCTDCRAFAKADYHVASQPRTAGEGDRMSDAPPTIMLIVRGLKSRLSHDERDRRYCV